MTVSEPHGETDPDRTPGLDGLWDVERTGGALPPLYGVRKRIAGKTGVTKAGRLPPMRFDVEDGGRRLRYRAPFIGLVDELEPEGDGFRGRSLLFGRELGRFVMRGVADTGGEAMADDLKEQLVKHIDEALAMEQNVLRMLDSMVATTEDEEIKADLRQHKLETEQQAERLRRRLEAHGASPSVVKEAGGVVGALMKSVVDMARGEKAGRNARDAYATEHMEIAAYELLERIAKRAGDEETAEVARRNRAEEEEMAKKIAARWDRFAELSLREEGIPV
jgi:ferritin-like metal-binding protein YciE